MAEPVFQRGVVLRCDWLGKGPLSLSLFLPLTRPVSTPAAALGISQPLYWLHWDTPIWAGTRPCFTGGRGCGSGGEQVVSLDKVLCSQRVKGKLWR